MRRTTRCSHGFIDGICVVPLCPHWDHQHGIFDKNRTVRMACESCGGPMVRGHNGGSFSTMRVCSKCVAAVEADRARREAQNAWL